MNRTEEALARIWSSVLKVERVASSDGFIELGGHSLLAAQVVWQVAEQLQVDLPFEWFFECQTLAAMASRIDGVRREPLHD